MKEYIILKSNETHEGVYHHKTRKKRMKEYIILKSNETHEGVYHPKIKRNA